MKHPPPLNKKQHDPGRYKIYTETYGGNVHEAATYINEQGLAQYLLSLTFTGGSYSTAVFKMPAEMVHKLRADDRSYVADPHHDDYRGDYDKHE